MEIVMLTLLSVTVLGATILGVVSVVASNKLNNKLSDMEMLFDGLERNYQRGDEGILQAIDEINRRLDSRTDKLQHSFEKEIGEVYRILDDRQKTTEDNIRNYLSTWQNSEEFAMILNTIRKTEFDSNLSKSY